jgi:S-(hydroxymethyl)glutathione dehydrogenase / alcohol dehydrogenase
MGDVPMRGVVWDGVRLHLTDQLAVREPGPGEVQVRVLASGICHSDLNAMDYPMMPTPIVLGHEAAGVVKAIGEGVVNVKVGEPVMVGSQTPCGHCRECQSERYIACDMTYAPVAPPFTWRGQSTHSFANISSFAGLITVKAEQLVNTEGLKPAAAALVGCAVSTGYGAARNLGEVRRGDVVVVFGVGGIGINAIQGARVAGAARVIAVDVNADKESAARKFGTSDFVLLPRGLDPRGIAEHVTAAIGAPVDVVIECSGVPAAVEASINIPKRGGTCVLVGQPAPQAMASFNVFGFTMGRKIVSQLNGGTNPRRDFAALIDLAREGEIDIDSQITRVWPLAEFETAMAALRSGQVVRAVLDHTA